MASFLLATLAALPSVLAIGTPKTCSNTQLSCHNTTSVADTCCFNAPGGQILQTQFWDSDPATGPSDSWTIHGLWPDHCDGTFDANCDSARAYTNITQILQSFGKTDLLSYMQTYWKDYQGNDESFWEHEWGKHGTCMSTFKPSCYNGYTATQEVPDFFQKTVDLFKQLDSYSFLSAAGIVPSATKTYTSAAILAALKNSFGFDVIIQCSSSALDEIWYSYNVRGSVQTGTFEAANPDGSKSDCPATGIKYLPKSGGGSTPSSTTTTSSGPAPTGGVFSGSGYVNGISGGSAKGCLIGAGTWYVGGTCATYTATPTSAGFTLKSSKGPCGISSSGTFTCASGVTSTVFTSTGGKLTYNNASTFYAAAVPSGSTQQTVYTASKATSVQFQWQSV